MKNKRKSRQQRKNPAQVASVKRHYGRSQVVENALIFMSAVVIVGFILLNYKG